ncbi:MAG: bifunctional 4-hydroxy-2-oxoglutarate aldolase/2-dehydro-3-deoxy-phosphogluconate aldolase [Lachnoclostridium sp.]|jgi:2-dehydro-3-deoxyphosphogluconate aldolase/(4S)-4-hydroxy-2-oxoglutarate aldolase|nr:bifunctional 4-hydroxy-2-oxoglutarate aldolase/2-dehydro-3-deoxy-phosphogluconate aldolase [Lachnoclostridium sp.]
MIHILDIISKIGIVPVIALDHAKDAEPLANALCKGSLPIAEVTFRTDAAEESIRIMTTKFPDMLVGAGTVLTTEQADKAILAGAKFIVSPGCNPRIIKYCQSKEIDIIPGCSSASDIEQALECGLDTVKFFPAEDAGGIKMIKALSAPYHSVKFLPTGGINANNLNSYLSLKKVIACGGSWMVNKEDIRMGEFEKITSMAKQAVQTMLDFQIKSVGNLLSKNMLSDIFAGEDGTILLKTSSIVRAVFHLERQGFSFDMDSAEYDASKELLSICFQSTDGTKVRLVC